MNEYYIQKGDKKLRCGFTTGSCASAAAKAALMMLISGEDIYNVSILTPKGIPYNAEIVDIKRDEEKKEVSCAVIKDGGDDPDATTGARIVATVSILEDSCEDGYIEIYGGDGVGRVTKKGLDQPVGEAAINSVPRKMIKENLSMVLKNAGLSDKGVKVIISVPGGEEIAQKTFNPKLGIIGGISILGTTGVVEPMSDSAIIETIKTEIRVRKAEESRILLAAPGNYGLSFLNEVYGIDVNKAVMSSNFIYDTIKIATSEGFSKLLFAGHIGKLIKVAGGIKNTHSMYGDHRMEILSSIVEDVSRLTESETKKLCDEILSCVMTDEAVSYISQKGIGDDVFTEMARRIKTNMESWSEGKLSVEVIVFSNENNELVASSCAHEWLGNI